MDATAPLAVQDHRAAMMDILNRQKRAQIDEGPPPAHLRIDRINRCIGMLVDYRDRIVEALVADFGSRPTDMTALGDVYMPISGLRYARDHVEAWMRPEERPTSPTVLSQLGASAVLHFRPKGVVGVIGSWNGPGNSNFAPLADIFAAGNRAMIKPSEGSPATSALIKEMFASAFSEEEVAVFTGGVDVSQAFASLPFDHLLFTGGTSIARHVMRAAAENLTPVTLELGGKNPVVISRGADMKMAAMRIMHGKIGNAGQNCLAPDYVLVPEERQREFVSEATAAVHQMYPTLKDNPDYTSMIDQRHYDRAMGYVEDARSKGAEIIEINPAGEDLGQQPHHKIAPTLILDPTDEMTVMQEEVFSPVMSVKSYKTVDEALAYINTHERPLALYYFGTDDAEREKVLNGAMAGGVTVNDVMMHVVQAELPFGGVGASGMGRYHGREGFLEFSHQQTVFMQVKQDLPQLAGMRPPFGEGLRAFLDSQITR